VAEIVAELRNLKLETPIKKFLLEDIDNSVFTIWPNPQKNLLLSDSLPACHPGQEGPPNEAEPIIVPLFHQAQVNLPVLHSLNPTEPLSKQRRKKRLLMAKTLKLLKWVPLNLIFQ
jgi:hypothetical protein